MLVRGVDLVGAGAGAMAAMGEQVQLKRHVVLFQGACQQQAVFHGHSLIFHGVPDEERRHIGAHLVFQAHGLQQGFIRAAQVLKRAAVGKLAAGDNGVPQHHRIGAGFGSGNTKGLLHGSCIPQQGGGSRQVGTGRKANDGDLIRRNAQVRRIPAQVQDGGRGFGQRLPQQRGVVGGINQGEHMVAGLQKLDSNRVRFARGAVAVGATIYFGSEQSRRQLVEIAEAFEYAHELGMATILWCYLRNNDFKKGAVDYHAAADLTGQADRLGVTIKADIVKQKLPTNNGGFKAIGFGKIDESMYTELASEHPIDLCRYQVANGYMGRVGLINSGGESHGSSDLRDAVITAVVNKRAGGMGLISGRKAFQKPMNEGVELLNTIQDVYLDSSITIA